jgi:hypothetical protein
VVQTYKVDRSWLLTAKRKTAASFITGSGFETFDLFAGYSVIASSFRITIAGTLPRCR